MAHQSRHTARLTRTEERTILWVTFDAKCTDRGCAYGFAQTDDALYRLYSVPGIEGYAEPSVYRKQVSRRRRMARTKVFSRSRSVPARRASPAATTARH